MADLNSLIISMSLALLLFSFILSAIPWVLPLFLMATHGYSPLYFLLSPTSSPSVPSVHGHTLLCRWLPVSGWLPLVTVCFARRGLIQLSEGTVTWAEQKFTDSELMMVDSREQSIVGRASRSERSEVAKVGSKAERKRGIGWTKEWIHANEN